MRPMCKMIYPFLLTLIFAVMTTAMDPEGEIIREEEWNVVTTNDDGIKKNNTLIFEVPLGEIKRNETKDGNTNLNLNNASNIALVVASVPENKMGIEFVLETKQDPNGQSNDNKTEETKSPDSKEHKKVEHEVVEAEFDLLRNQVADSSIKVPNKDDKVTENKDKEDKQELKSSSKIGSENNNESTSSHFNRFKFQPMRHFPNPFISLFNNLRRKLPLKSSTVKSQDFREPSTIKSQSSKVKSFSEQTLSDSSSSAYGYGPYDSFDTKVESKKSPIISKLQKQTMHMPKSRSFKSKLISTTTTTPKHEFDIGTDKPIISNQFDSVELIPESVFFNRKRSDALPSQFTMQSISLPDKDSEPTSLESILRPRQPVNFRKWSKQLDDVDFGPQPSRSGSSLFPSGLSGVLGNVFSNIKNVLGEPNRNELSKTSMFRDLSAEDNSQKERVMQHLKNDVDLLEKDLYSLTEMGRRSEDLLAHIKRVLAQLQMSSQDNNQKLAGSFSNGDTIAQSTLGQLKPGMTAEVEIILEPALDIMPEDSSEETVPFKSIKPASFASMGKTSSSPFIKMIKDILTGSRSKPKDVPLFETIVV